MDRKRLGGCLFYSALAIWNSSLLKDDRAILSVQHRHILVCKRLETLYNAFLYMSLKIVSLVFHHFV